MIVVSCPPWIVAVLVKMPAALSFQFPLLPE
jgi:hypothetical protein